MNWTSPGILTALWILPVFALLLWRQRKRQKRREELFLQSPMTGRLFPEATARRAFWRGALLLASLALLITALAGPRFGVYFEKVTRRGADILILLDTSRSMLAEDLAPNRLEAAKLDIEDLLSAVSGDRVGLIAFAGKPVIKVPLTSDFGFFRETLKGLDTHAAPMGGTAIGDAVRLALRAMAPDAARDQAILLITDGEDHESMPIEAAQSAAQRNVRLFTVALGDTKEGARIPLFDKNGKRTGFEQYNGQEVWSKADVDLLARLAETANGTFLSAGTGPCDLGEFYLSAMEDLSRAGYGQSQQRLLHEKYQLFLALGLAALTLWLAIPAAARPRWEEEIQPAARDAAERKTGAGAFLRRAIMPAAAAALALIGGAAPADTPPQTPPITTAQPTAEGADPRPAPEEISSEGISPEEFSPEEMTPEEMTPEEWDESAGVESAQKEKKLSPRERYREACAKRDDPAASAEAEEIFDALMRGNEDKRLTPLCAYNLALIKARRLSEAAEAANAEEPDKSQPPNGAEEPANPADPNGGTPQARPKDPLTLYREGRAAREGKRREVRRQTAEAADLFHEADDPKDSRLHREVTGNIDLLRSWLIGQEKRWADAERQKRLALGLPTHLAWLAGELDAVLAEPALAKDPAASKQYQGLYDLAGRIDEARADLRGLADAAEMRGAVEGEKTDEPALDPQTASAAAEALERAVGDARRFARADTRDAVRLGAEKLDAGFNAVMDYRTVLSDALARQEKVVQRGKALAEKTAKNAADNQADSKADSEADNQANNEAVGAMCWGDDFAGRKVERLIGEAEAEFQRQPWSDEEEQAAGEEESAGEEDSTGEQPDEEQPNPALGGEDQQRAKLRRSMKAALDLGPEVGQILASLPASAEELPAIRAGEGRILEILREIERPLRDDQDQNSDSQDQNNQDNKNQNDKNQDNQDNQNRDNQNKDNQNQDNQDQNQDQDNQEQNSQDQNSQNEEEQSAEEQSADEQDQRQRADQQQAEAAMRKVRQRQQQAEQMRRLRDEYQRRVDKPEKDW